jgi:D-alanyl-D-alanine carboxypeptidase
MRSITISALIACFLFLALSSAKVSAADISTSARSAVLMEIQSGDIIYEQNSHEKLPMASTTKIMTAICAIENGELDKKVRISDDVCGIEGSSVYLKSGEELTLRELLYAVMLESANDAAAAVAVTVSGSVEKFAELMNSTANRIGADETHFTNPHGLDDEQHYTTAEDLARIAAYGLQNDTFRDIVSSYKMTIPMNSGDGVRLLLNHNKMLRLYDGSVGVKTGFTKRSGRCLVSAAERDGMTLVAVTLNDPNDWNDHTLMLDAGFKEYEMRTIAGSSEFCYEMPVTGGTTSSVKCLNKDIISAPMKKDSGDISFTVEAERFVFAPINEGDILAYVTVKYGNNELQKIPLYAENGVAIMQQKDNIKDLFDKIFG